MGNALWKGARLRDVLTKAGVKAGAVAVRFNGAETPVLAQTPDFVKALDIDHALHEDTIVAYEMNGGPLPVLNGFPLRLVVPGWFATYWVKMLTDIEVIDHVDDGYWMKTAYRIPATPTGGVAPGSTGFATVPINKLTIRSFITNLSDGRRVAAAKPTPVRGIAFDSGSGIRSVEFSTAAARRGARPAWARTSGSTVSASGRRASPRSPERRTNCSAADLERRRNAVADRRLESGRLPPQRPGNRHGDGMKRAFAAVVATLAIAAGAWTVARAAGNVVVITLPAQNAAFKPGPNVALTREELPGVPLVGLRLHAAAAQRAQWTTEVTELVKAYGAPVPDGDVARSSTTSCLRTGSRRPPRA